MATLEATVDMEALDLEVPTQKRRRNVLTGWDPDNTPRSLHRRPILRPTSPSKRNQSRSPSPKHRPVATTYDLRRLEKPVFIQFGGSRDDFPPDVKDLLRSIQRIHSKQLPFIPAEVREEVTAIMRYRGIGEPEEPWISQPRELSRRDTALEELGKFLDICHASTMSAAFPRHEAAWNSEVHHPLLNLAFHDANDVRQNEERLRLGIHDDGQRGQAVRLRVENITSATITADYVPRWKSGLSDNTSLLAWSVHTSSSAARSSTSSAESSSSTRDFGQSGASSNLHHDKTGSKKADFALVIEPMPDSSLYTALHTVLQKLGPTDLQSINPSGYTPLLEAPIGAVIEAKAASATRDPLVQLGMMATAIHRRLHTLPVRGAVGVSSITETGVIMPLPLLAVTNDQWSLYFARDDGRKIDIVGPFGLGSTHLLDDCYQLLAAMRLIKIWILDYFCPALEKWLTPDDI